MSFAKVLCFFFGKKQLTCCIIRSTNKKCKFCGYSLRMISCAMNQAQKFFPDAELKLKANSTPDCNWDVNLITSNILKKKKSFSKNFSISLSVSLSSVDLIVAVDNDFDNWNRRRIKHVFDVDKRYSFDVKIKFRFNEQKASKCIKECLQLLSKPFAFVQSIVILDSFLSFSVRSTQRSSRFLLSLFLSPFFFCFIYNFCFCFCVFHRNVLAHL